MAFGSPVSVVKAEARSRPSPDAETPLARADALFGARDFQKAANAYERIRLEGGSSSDAKAAQFKEAVCQQFLLRERDARAGFEEAFQDNSSIWRAGAAAKLYLFAVKARDFDKARDYLSAMLASRPEDIARTISDAELFRIREAFLAYGQSQSVALNLRIDQSDVDRLQKMREFDRTLGFPAFIQNDTKLKLAEALALAGSEEDAAVLFLELLEHVKSLDIPERLQLYDYLAWLSIRHPEIISRDFMLRTLENEAFLAPNLDLKLCKARLLYAEGRVDDAREFLDSVLRLSDRQQHWLDTRMDAQIMMGFMMKGSRDDWAAAEAYWKTAYLEARKAGHTSTLGVSILGSLSGELSDTDARKMVSDVFQKESAAFPVVRIVNVLLPPEVPRALREMWRTPRGRKAAKQHAFRKVAVRDLFVQQVHLSCLELIRYGAFDGKFSQEQEQLTWNYVCSEVGAFRNNQADWNVRLVPLYLAWAGNLPQDQWLKLEQELQKVNGEQLPYLC